MADDLFRARVEPRRDPAPTEAWPEEWDRPAEEVLDDLMASFDRHRVELDERLASTTAEQLAAEGDTATTEPELPSQPEPAPAPPDPAPLPPNPVPAPTTASREPASAAPGLAKAVPPTAPPATAASAAAPPAAPPSDPVAPAAPPPRRSRRPWLIAGAALVVAAGTGAVVTAVAASSSSGPSTSPAASPSGPAVSSTAPVAGGPASTPAPSSAPAAAPTTDPATAAQAAAWIAANVGPGHVIACDVTVCAMLRGHGFPAASVVTIQSLAHVEQADIVAVTDVVRQQLGTSLAGVIAGQPMAVFTAGSSTIAVTPVALDGPAAYAARLAGDRQARKAAGTALLHNPRITVAPAARAALSGGLVDTRVCTLLAVLGGSHTLTVAAFTGTGPGAGPDVPLPGVVISRIDGASAASDSAHTTTLKNIVAAQRPPYAPLSVTRIASGPDQGLAILFAQPGPTGLLTATTP